MTDAADVALEKASIAACEAGHHAWPSTDGYNDRAEKRAFREIAKAAIEAYLAALPKGELAERLVKEADMLDEYSGEPVFATTAPLLRAAASLLGGGVPEGWVMVPKKPTRKMLDEMGRYRVGDYGTGREFYKAMIAARPPESGRE